jgi:hypothetical protein
MPENVCNAGCGRKGWMTFARLGRGLTVSKVSDEDACQTRGAGAHNNRHRDAPRAARVQPFGGISTAGGSTGVRASRTTR